RYAVPQDDRQRRDAERRQPRSVAVQIQRAAHVEVRHFVEHGAGRRGGPAGLDDDDRDDDDEGRARHPARRLARRCRTFSVTVASAIASEMASGNLACGRNPTCDPMRRFASPNVVRNSAASAAPAGSSASAASGETRKWKFQSARSGCCTYANTHATGTAAIVKALSTAVARRQPTGASRYSAP